MRDKIRPNQPDKLKQILAIHGFPLKCQFGNDVYKNIQWLNSKILYSNFFINTIY